MNGQNDNALESFKAQYREQIAAKEREIEALRAKLKSLEEIAKDFNPFAPADKYLDFGLTAAVLDAVKSLHQIGAGVPDGLSTVQIGNYLKAQGYRPKENFAVALHVTLDRLSDKNDGRLILSLATGKKHFRPSKKISGTGGGLTSR